MNILQIDFLHKILLRQLRSSLFTYICRQGMQKWKENLSNMSYLQYVLFIIMFTIIVLEYFLSCLLLRYNLTNNKDTLSCDISWLDCTYLKTERKNNVIDNLSKLFSAGK